MSGIIALETYAKEIGGGSGSAVPLKCCTKSRAIGFGCATAPLAGYSDNQLVKVSDIETGVYVTELKVYHHRGTEPDNTFDNYEEITEFTHSNWFRTAEYSSYYVNEFVVEAVYSSGAVENVSHRVKVHRIATSTYGIQFELKALTDGTESVIAVSSTDINNGYKYTFSFGGVTKTIDGWLYRPKIQRLEIGNLGSNPYPVNPTNPYDSNAVYVDLSMRIEGNEVGPDNGYGYSSSVFQVLGNYTVDGRYLIGGSNHRFNIGSSSYFPFNLKNLGPNYRSFLIYSTTFMDYNGTGGNDKIIESDVDVTIKLGDIAQSTVIDNNSLTRTVYTLRSPSSPL
jgi:hypothetical protein